MEVPQVGSSGVANPGLCQPAVSRGLSTALLGPTPVLQQLRGRGRGRELAQGTAHPLPMGPLITSVNLPDPWNPLVRTQKLVRREP